MVLADGEFISLSAGDLKAVYEELWNLAGERGAITAAEALLHVRDDSPPIKLDERQTAAFRHARSRLASLA